MTRRREALGWLSPLAWAYSAGARLRAWCYRRGIFRVRRLPGRVISVGNLTVGGTGKTPTVLWLAEQLAAEGKRAAILTRGYRGTRSSEARGEPQSDEVALLRNRLNGKVQMGVGANRYENGLALARHGAEWFVLDDGFQHLELARDVDIVLLDASDPFGGGKTLPAGRLREPISAIQRADLVLITRTVQSPAPAIESMVRRFTNCPIHYATTRLESVLRIPQLAVALPAEDWTRARFFAFCGIGNPEAFFEDLRRWRFQLVGERSFGDHHVYSPQESAQLEKSAQGCGADALLCTEKDVWNLRQVQFAGIPAYCCRINIEIPGEAFYNCVQAAIGRTRGETAA